MRAANDAVRTVDVLARVNLEERSACHEPIRSFRVTFAAVNRALDTTLVREYAIAVFYSVDEILDFIHLNLIGSVLARGLRISERYGVVGHQRHVLAILGHHNGHQQEQVNNYHLGLEL